MPTLAVARNYLHQLLGRTYTQRQFEDICFEFGIELDDVTSEREMYMREHGKLSAGGSGGGDEDSNASKAAVAAAAQALSDDVLYKIETPANRYDLLSCEGLTTALKVFLGTAPLPRWRVLHGSSPLYTMTVRKSVKNVRDYVVCAVLRNIRFSEYSYNSFIDLQEKLHSGLARRRTLASVGTHDLDKIKHDAFIYEAAPKETLRFVPLRQTTVLDCANNGLEAYYVNDRQISKYVPLIASMPRYPVIRCARTNEVLSLPPIINSAYSCISAHTRNVLIECTAPDHYRAQVLVNQLVTSFSMHCDEPFTVEAVKVEYEEPAPDGTQIAITPCLDTTPMQMSVARLNSIIGVNMKDGHECARLLERMMYTVKEVKDDTVVVDVPAVRSDVLGASDVMEDVAIAYGYDKITYQECTTRGLVTQTPLSKVSQLLRQEMASAGYVELLTFSLCSRDEAFAHLGRIDKDVAVHIANPQTIEFQVCRPSLLPGMLKTLSANKALPLPHRFFECADVVLLDNAANFPPELEVPGDGYPSPGARNQRHIAAISCNSSNSSFEQIHGLTEYIMCKLNIQPYNNDNSDATTTTAAAAVQRGDAYSFEQSNDGAFFPGRALDILLWRNGKATRIGSFGVVHPNTLKAYDITTPCSYVEMNMQFACTA